MRDKLQWVITRIVDEYEVIVSGEVVDNGNAIEFGTDYGTLIVDTSDIEGTIWENAPLIPIRETIVIALGDKLT
jgi:hypothetical protein